MIKRILKPFLISLIQIIGLIFTHDILYYYYPMYHRSIGFGLTIIYTESILFVSIIAFNYYLEFIKKKIYLVAFGLLIITIISPLMAFDYRPLRSLLLILMAFCGYSSSLIISNWKTKKKLTRKFG